MKRFIVLIVLLSFLGGASLSFFAMNHEHMSNDCSASTSVHHSVCPDAATSFASHYLSMYQSFTNVLFSALVTQGIPLALLFIFVVVLYNYASLIPRLFILSRSFRVRVHQTEGIIRWLSLLVNSPSFR